MHRERIKTYIYRYWVYDDDITVYDYWSSPFSRCECNWPKPKIAFATPTSHVKQSLQWIEIMTSPKPTAAYAKFTAIIAVAALLIAQPVSGIADGGGGGDSDMPTSQNLKKKFTVKCVGSKVWDRLARKCKLKKKKLVIKCVNGKIWDGTRRKCTKEVQSSGLDQNSIYAYGRDLARDGQFENAIRVLYLAHDQNDPRVLNYLGYSNRKLGNMDKALGYYRAAVASNPDYSLVREYLGEAYVQLGQLEKAREQLTQIERICGAQSCRQYSMLSKYIIDSQLQ